MLEGTKYYRKKKARQRRKGVLVKSKVKKSLTSAPRFEGSERYSPRFLRKKHSGQKEQMF
jgi:hypothetical protein